MPSAHDPPETASGCELDDGATLEVVPDDWLDELPEEAVVELLELPPDEFVGSDVLWVAASPVKAAVAVTARTPIARVMRFTRRRFRSR
jgi:hypothetical protein